MGSVALQNDSLATLLARLEGILGPLPQHMVRKGRFSHRFYTRQGVIYERSQRTVSTSKKLWCMMSLICDVCRSLQVLDRPVECPLEISMHGLHQQPAHGVSKLV